MSLAPKSPRAQRTRSISFPSLLRHTVTVPSSLKATVAPSALHAARIPPSADRRASPSARTSDNSPATFGANRGSSSGGATAGAAHGRSGSSEAGGVSNGTLPTPLQAAATAATARSVTRLTVVPIIDAHRRSTIGRVACPTDDSQVIPALSAARLYCGGVCPPGPHAAGRRLDRRSVDRDSSRRGYARARGAESVCGRPLQRSDRSLFEPLCLDVAPDVSAQHRTLLPEPRRA